MRAGCFRDTRTCIRRRGNARIVFGAQMLYSPPIAYRGAMRCYMDIHADETRAESGAAAAALAASRLSHALSDSGGANLILATGASQFDMLQCLVHEDVDWSRVTCFHLDEYIGLPESHAASFRGYLRERFLERVPRVAAFHFVDGYATDPEVECRRLGEIICDFPIDVACVGIGENGHLAFNDPPADFETDEPYLVVELDEACRRQQLGEGWFAALDDVPKRAISMSIRQMLKSRTIVCTAPDARKAQAVRDTVEGPVTNMLPASILQQHPDCHLFLDAPASALLTSRT